MGDNRAEQIEALEIFVEFNERLVKNMEIVVKELLGKRLDDTDKFFKDILDAINWEVQVLNGTMELLNDGTERLNKQQINDKIMALGSAIKEKNDIKCAEAIKELIPEFEKIGIAAKEVIA